MQMSGRVTFDTAFWKPEPLNGLIFGHLPDLCLRTDHWLHQHFTRRHSCRSRWCQVWCCISCAVHQPHCQYSCYCLLLSGLSPHPAGHIAHLQVSARSSIVSLPHILSAPPNHLIIKSSAGEHGIADLPALEPLPEAARHTCHCAE